MRDLSYHVVLFPTLSPVCFSSLSVQASLLLFVLFAISSLNKYRKIPNVSPGLIEVFKHFLGGLYSGGLIFGGAYIRRAFCVSVRVSRP